MSERNPLGHGWGVRGVMSLPQPEGRGPNGRRLCRWCHEEVGPRRQTFCGEECVTAFKSRTTWRLICLAIARRDKACRNCGAVWPMGAEAWERDHILPVADGGDDRPENLRLLCRPCHVTVTTEWRRSRAAGNREETEG